MSSPSNTTDLAWVYAGPGGADSSRLYNPYNPNNPTLGCGTTSPGWISKVNGSSISTIIPLGGLSGDGRFESEGNLLGTNVYTLTFFHAAESLRRDRVTAFRASVTSSGTLTFLSGGNGDGSQILTRFFDSGTNFGGNDGVTPERSWTLNFLGTGLTTSDTIIIKFNRVSFPTPNTAFTIIDDVALSVTAIPEPTTATLAVLGVLAVARRRRVKQLKARRSCNLLPA